MNNADASVFNCLNELFEQSIWELHQLMGLELVEKVENSDAGLKKEEQGACIVSILTAASEGLKVSASIILPSQLVIKLHDKHDSATEYDLHDYCGEINNQLVGRFKNKLLTYNVRLLLGLPTTLAGRDITGHTLAESMSCIRYFTHSGINFSIVFQLIASPEFEMQNHPDASDDQPAEGELSFF